MIIQKTASERDGRTFLGAMRESHEVRSGARDTLVASIAPRNPLVISRTESVAGKVSPPANWNHKKKLFSLLNNSNNSLRKA
jgi:hypothetical protein